MARDLVAVVDGRLVARDPPQHSWLIVAAAEQVGIRAVVVDAIDENAAAFYRRFGFTDLTPDGLTLMATVAQLRAADR